MCMIVSLWPNVYLCVHVNFILLKPCLSHAALVCMYIVYIYNLYVHHMSFVRRCHCSVGVIVALKIYYMFTYNVTCLIVLYVHDCVSMALIVRDGQLEVVKYLIEAQGCSTDCTNKLGMTPLHFACR